MKKVYSILGLSLTFVALMTLTLSATFVQRVRGAEQSPWEGNIAGNEEFTNEPPPLQLSEDNTIRATFLIDYRWFTFRLVYNQTTETYSVYSLGELIVGQSSLKDRGELVAENMEGPAISSNGTYNPLEINSWFRIKTIDDVTIVYYDGVEVLTLFSENLPSEVIKVLSPENRTYNTPDVPLEYMVNKIFYTATYSLDGQANQTIIGNTVLTGLIEGPHSIVVYIEAAPENITASKTIYFTVSLVDNETKIFTPQTNSSIKTESTSTNGKNEAPDYSKEEPETIDVKEIKEDDPKEIPMPIPQDTNIPNTNIVFFNGIILPSFLTFSIGKSNLSLMYALIGILVTAMSWFFTAAKIKKHQC